MTIRPQSLSTIVGQQEAVDILKIAISSAKQRQDSLPHCLFYGNPGLGKTSFALAIANDFGTPIQVANGGSISGIKSILPYLMRLPELGKGSILFIDEIHRLPAKVEEFLYPAMEDFKVSVGAEDNAEEIDLESFTLIGATTESGSLSQPLYDRFKYKVPLRYYSLEDMSIIIKDLAKKLFVNIDDASIERLAAISRGTPRVAVQYTEWVRDYCLAKNIAVATKNHVDESLQMLGIDEQGLTEEDRTYLAKLESLLKRQAAVGIKALATALSMSEETITHKIEPYLVRLQIICRTSKGRCLINKNWSKS
jgi:Holliday junction DNA helicase RuvB